MKILKYIYVFTLSTLITLMLIGNLKIFASDIYTSDNNNGTWTPTSTTTTTINGVTHSLMYGNSSDKSEATTGNQMVNLFEMKTDGVNSKLVTWAISGKTTYSRAGLSAIAKDYEKTHPGWIVVAGINGDQYYTKYGSGLGTDGSFYYYNQPYYPMVIDGERRFAITPTGGSSRNYVGIANNGSFNSMVAPSTLDGLKIEILNDKNEVIYIHNVDKVNQTPTNNEVSVWITYNSSTSSGTTVEHNVNSTKSLYIVENAEQVYMSNSITYTHGGGADALFARGTIDLISENYTFTSGTFGIETSNQELTNKLNNGTKIRVQYYYTNDEMNNVEASMGYHSIQRYDDIDIDTDQAYDTRRYNRSIFGRKADGTYVLMTVAKGEYSGTTHNESNAILKQYGVVEAYQQDGGGSVTAIIRNSNDEFDVLNESSDSGSKERSIFNGCFFVVRDSGYRSYQKDSTKNSITISKVNNYNDEYISNVKAIVNNKEYLITDDKLTIENLSYDTKYIIDLVYDVTLNGKTVTTTQQIIAHTDSFTMPSSGIKAVKVTANSIILERKKVTEDEVVFAKAIVNNTEYDLKNEDTKIEINNLTPSTIYTIEIHYAIKDLIDGKIYEAHEQLIEMTKKYNLPEIKTFEIISQTKKSIEVKVSIKDEFNLAYAYYISYNGKQYELEELEGTYIIEDLDLKNNIYELTLIIQYKENNAFKSINSNTLYTNLFTSKCNKNNVIYINIISLSMLMYIVFKKRK